MDVEVNLWFNLMLFLLWNVVNICFFLEKELWDQILERVVLYGLEIIV